MTQSCCLAGTTPSFSFDETIFATSSHSIIHHLSATLSSFLPSSHPLSASATQQVAKFLLRIGAAITNPHRTLISNQHPSQVPAIAPPNHNPQKCFLEKIGCRGRTAEIVAGPARQPHERINVADRGRVRDRNKNRYLFEAGLDSDAGFSCQPTNQAGTWLHDGEVQEKERRGSSPHFALISSHLYTENGPGTLNYPSAGCCFLIHHSSRPWNPRA